MLFGIVLQLLYCSTKFIDGMVRLYELSVEVFLVSEDEDGSRTQV